MKHSKSNRIQFLKPSKICMLQHICNKATIIMCLSYYFQTGIDRRPKIYTKTCTFNVTDTFFNKDTILKQINKTCVTVILIA